MSGFWNKVKFYLGLPVVANHNGKGWVVTKRQGGLLRVCKSTTDSHWWCNEEYWLEYCIFESKEAAEKSLKTKKFDVT